MSEIAKKRIRLLEVLSSPEARKAAEEEEAADFVLISNRKNILDLSLNWVFGCRMDCLLG